MHDGLGIRNFCGSSRRGYRWSSNGHLFMMSQQQSYWFGTLYLIHFDQRLPNPNGHGPQHYLGYVDNGNLEDRLKLHQGGQGSRLLLAVTQAGIGWHVVRTLPGDRNTERRLKRHRNLPRYCPVCNPDHYETGWTDRKGRKGRKAKGDAQ